MTPEQIREAVELAEGFGITEKGVIYIDDGDYMLARCHIDKPSPSLIDALAAQLVRQVDALAPEVVFTCGFHGEVMVYSEIADEDWTCGYDVKGKAGDRTMNTIRAIIDSGVLK